jgi:hypothetical protein
VSSSPQPVLSAGRGLLLRPWTPTDAPAFLSAYQDDEIRRWHTRRPLTEAQVLEWFDAYREDWERERGGHWAIAADGGDVLGRIATRGWNFDDGIAGVAYLMQGRHQGRLPARRHQTERRSTRRRPTRHAPSRPHPGRLSPPRQPASQPIVSRESISALFRNGARRATMSKAATNKSVVKAD